MLGLMFPYAFFYFQHCCINRWKRHFPSINVLLDIGAACAQMYFAQKNLFCHKTHVFCQIYWYWDWCWDWCFRIQFSHVKSQYKFKLNLICTHVRSFAVGLIMLRRNRGTWHLTKIESLQQYVHQYLVQCVVWHADKNNWLHQPCDNHVWNFWQCLENSDSIPAGKNINR